jgi:hypothetical protein
VDNLSTPRATDVLLLLLAHPRWAMVFQPTYAAHLNLIEAWWKILRSLALPRPERPPRWFESWDELARAGAGATACWSAHRHPFAWGHRRRHRLRPRPGIALPPQAA